MLNNLDNTTNKQEREPLIERLKHPTVIQTICNTVCMSLFTVIFIIIYIILKLGLSDIIEK
ncbi:hypothetical protein KM1_255820 [Entamoeba histolytica HM-3:IMSS]|uniref:Uncharacterized protein n=1 Tax=Entamoeba histolytica HM-3:IMSS TaxID=885315 RepID=M7WWI9_ENTHI|nr:hypothetical protein KM1_255820 [Entamoeba histolytica HM-3:IMSS]